jgi:probable rRNA maturation factor
MRVDIYNGTRQKTPNALLRRAADIFEKKMRISKTAVSVAFVGEQRMRVLNKHYRGTDRVTDILSFAERNEKGYMGELVICSRQIRRQARRQKTSVRAELLFIFIHGLLHLIGYDDATERGWREMERIGTRLCKSIK